MARPAIDRLQPVECTSAVLEYAVTHKIFLSHNYKDKPLVEPVALKLAGIFGHDKVFYDAWSIRPGDGIIDQMNKGLEAPEFVFFFVSATSLASGMVKLEWQNALYTASKGKTRIIPVRVDGCDMPAVLRQTLFIDMHTIGLDAAISQIVSVTQGYASFTPQHQGFSNLTYTAIKGEGGSIEVAVQASHLMEPNSSFLIVTPNPEDEIAWKMKNDSGFMGGFNQGFVSDQNGRKFNAISMRPMGGTLTPDHPFRALLTKKGDTDIAVIGVMHQKRENQWVPVPDASPKAPEISFPAGSWTTGLASR